MQKKYIIGLDQSTSGTKVVLVDELGQIIYKQSKEHAQYYPVPGWVEHDLTEIADNCITLVKEAIEVSKENRYEVIGISITNQRETIAFWDATTGAPLCNAIVWQCRRSTDICKVLKEQGYGPMVEEKTGLQLDPYFSASKIKWALENNEAVKQAAEKGTLKIGTIDAWVIYVLTQGRVHATDHTNASRTMLYNITEHDWDLELLDLFGVPKEALPSILSSNGVFGETEEQVLGVTLPIAGVIGDSQGALFGQQCFEKGLGKVTYGTGSSILLYIGEQQIRSNRGVLTSVAWGIDGKIQYALEGIINSSGDTLKWVKDNLGLYQQDTEVDELVRSIDSCEGVYVIPAFVGLGAPYWKPGATASIVGLTRKATKAHVVRAAVESMAYQVADLIHLMEEEAGQTIQSMNVDGGPTKNQFLMQLQSDLLQTKLTSSKYQELSVLGAVYLGGLGLKLWENLDALKALKATSNAFLPQMDKKEAEELLIKWQQVIESHT